MCAYMCICAPCFRGQKIPGEIGDWLVCQEDDHQNAYVIPRTVFEQSYERVE